MTRLPQPDAEGITLDAVLSALSDPHRRAIVELLVTEGDSLSGTCTAWAGIAPSAGSHHLRVLREAGITETRVEGNARIVSLRRDDLDRRLPGLLDSILSVSLRQPTGVDARPLLHLDTTS